MAGQPPGVFIEEIARGPRPIEGRSMAFAPCGMIAGVMSRTDAAQGVWKVPAGTGAKLRGVTGLCIKGQVGHLTDEASRPLNIAGINCLRVFQNVGVVVWGARTLAGADAMWSVGGKRAEPGILCHLRQDHDDARRHPERPSDR